MPDPGLPVCRTHEKPDTEIRIGFFVIPDDGKASFRHQGSPVSSRPVQPPRFSLPVQSLRFSRPGSAAPVQAGAPPYS